MWLAAPSSESLREPTARSAHCHQSFPECAGAHDAGMWKTATALPGETPGTETHLRDAEQIASLPMRMDGLALRCAGRCAPAAHWASRADALHMISQRYPTIAAFVVVSLGGADVTQEGCLGQVHECRVRTRIWKAPQELIQRWFPSRFWF